MWRYVYTITDRSDSQCSHFRHVFLHSVIFPHSMFAFVRLTNFVESIYIWNIRQHFRHLEQQTCSSDKKKYDLVYLIPQKVKIWRIWIVVVHALWCLTVRLCHPNRLCQLSIDVRLSPLSANPASPTGKYMLKVRHQNIRQACSVIRFLSIYVSAERPLAYWDWLLFKLGIPFSFRISLFNSVFTNFQTNICVN